MGRALVIIVLLTALIYAGAGLLPGRTFAPLDLPLDSDAWKPDPTVRVRVSNSLLSDVVVQFIPWDMEIRRHLSSGEMPWTNRYAGDGGPLFANPQTALFSPFTWLRLLLGLKGWALMAIAKIIVAALCAYWLARELDVDAAQAVVSGLVYAMAGYSIVWLLWPHTNVAVFLPGLTAASLRMMRSPGGRNGALVVLFAALCTAGGHPETLFAGVAGISIFLVLEARSRSALRGIVAPAIGALLGFSLLAVQLVPFFFILSNSYIRRFRLETVSSFRPWAVVSQFFPGVLGSPLRDEIDLTAFAAGDGFNGRCGGYIGALVLLAIIVSWRDLTASLRRGLMVGAAALLITFNLPLVPQLFRLIPIVRTMALHYFAVVFVMFGAVAAGPALFALASRRRRMLGGVVIALGLVMMTSGILPALPPARPALMRVARAGIDQLRARGHLHQPAEIYEQRLTGYLDAARVTAIRRAALPGAVFLIAGLAMFCTLRRREVVLSLAALGELALFGVGYNPVVRLTSFPGEPPAIAAIRSLDPAHRYLMAANFEVFPANVGTVYGTRDVVSYDVLDSADRIKKLIEAGYNPPVHSLNPILSPQQVRALPALGVRFILSRMDVAGARRVAGPPSPEVGVYEVDGAQPTDLPRNRLPAGLFIGGVLSALALLASAAWIRTFSRG